METTELTEVTEVSEITEVTEEIIQPSIYDKEFKDYTVTESYLCIIALLVLLLIVTCFVGKKR